jgi:hypothetical protein
MNRPKTYTIAAILQLLISLAAVVFTVSILFQGAAAVEQAYLTRHSQAELNTQTI